MGKRRPLRELDPAIKAELDRLLADDRHTIREVTGHLRKLGADVSKSAVGRYSQYFEHVTADMRLTREMANAIGKELADTPDDAGRMVIESLQALLLRARLQVGSESELDPKHVAMMCGAARDLQSALKLNIESSTKVRERAIAEAATAAESAAVAEGLSVSTIEAIKSRILGVKENA